MDEVDQIDECCVQSSVPSRMHTANSMWDSYGHRVKQAQFCFRVRPDFPQKRSHKFIGLQCESKPNTRHRCIQMHWHRQKCSGIRP